MSTCRDLDRYLDGQIAGNERHRFEEHAAACSACQAWIGQWRALEGKLREGGPDPCSRTGRPTMAQRTRLIDRASGRYSRGHGIRDRWILDFTLVVATVAPLIAVFGPWSIGGRDGEGRDPTTQSSAPISAGAIRVLTTTEAMAATIMSSPELQLEIERLAVEMELIELEKLRAQNDLETSKWQAETARIQAVNETMRAEAGADDKWQRRWRPFCGFVTGTTWGIIGISFAILAVAIAFGIGDVKPAALTDFGTAMAELSVFFGIMGAILGVSAWTRGVEKKERIKARNGS